MCCRRTSPLPFFSFNQNMLLVELKGETLFRKKKKELKKKENKLQNTAHKEGYLFTL